MPLQKNQVLTLPSSAFPTTAAAWPTARTARPYFVPGTAPGDEAGSAS